MDKLLRATLKHGLMPPVVMELPGITVGGGIQGAGAESSSFKHGCFNANCNWYEMILGDGQIVKASPTQHEDLFYGTAGAYGSLGVLTAVEMQLIPAKKYVNVSYRPVDSFEDAVKTLTQLSTEDYDFIDGIMFAAGKGVIIYGKLSNTASGKSARFSRAHDNWFYLHAAKKIRAGVETTESIPLADYLFRYDRGAFWTGQYTFERAHYPFSRFTRWLLNPMLSARKLYQALQETNAAQQYVVQDVVLPRREAASYLNFLDGLFGQYPLWLCPLKPDDKSPLLCNNVQTDLAINIGVWLGKRVESDKEFVAINRQIEAELQRCGGKKWLYAQSYYPEAEFWKIYGKDWYTKLRKKYHAEHLPDVYQKVISTRQPVKSIKRAAIKTAFGLSKLRIKD